MFAADITLGGICGVEAAVRVGVGCLMMSGGGSEFLLLCRSLRFGGLLVGTGESHVFL